MAPSSRSAEKLERAFWGSMALAAAPLHAARALIRGGVLGVVVLC